MKKILFLLFAAAAFAACNDDGEPKVRYATTNDGIENGYLQGANLHFYGTSTVTDAKGETFTDPEAWFEFAGGPESFSLYMHKTRFAANMPGVEMRLQTVTYTPRSTSSGRRSFPPPSKRTMKAEDRATGPSNAIKSPISQAQSTALTAGSASPAPAFFR
ncbi:hypothetical protein [Alistipes sp. 56_sp_Nov_56_25]|uniref:hypothetical protein n=1 Tax=Alistipes sp. 56_sp_Nov_56_25 TaxID=1896969 RepID=UPI000B2D3360|nr:hypothetical protein [Alistipes sp. 56_sp_Nov_56_25]